MNKKEYLKEVEDCKIKLDRVEKVEKLYGEKVNDELARIISYADKVDFFDEERRALSFKEIMNATKDMEVDMVKMGIIPLIDAYDCAYIVYSFSEKEWARFSTVDGTLYKKKKTFAEVL